MTASVRLENMRDVLWLCAVVLLLAALAFFGLGAVGNVISEIDEMCAHGLVYQGADLVEMREGLIPLERTCVFEDGTTYEDIPAWVNYPFLGGLAASLSCAAVAFSVGPVAKGRS